MRGFLCLVVFITLITGTIVVGVAGIGAILSVFSVVFPNPSAWLLSIVCLGTILTVIWITAWTINDINSTLYED